MKKYLALTIGPIIDTLVPMQKTASIFKASYMFSYLMREIFRELYSDVNIKDKILYPYIADENLLTLPQKAGIFPDTLIIETDEVGDFDKLISARNVAIKKLAPKIKIDETTITKNLQLYCLEWKCDEKDFLLEIRKHIAAIEKRKKGLDYTGFLGKIALKKTEAIFTDGLLLDAFADELTKFPLLVDITCHNLPNKTENPNRDADNFEKINKNDFRLYHKQIAVIQADGDNLGNFLRIFKDKNELQGFSKKLMKFATDARDIITNYGGLPVYIGGDDMLMFVPLVSNNKQSIFHLISNIDAKFSELYKEYSPKVIAYNVGKNDADKAKPLTMSYGIAITYYKFPLNEARELAFNNLEEAKKQGKNRIVMKSLEHRIDLNLDKLTTCYAKYVQPSEATCITEKLLTDEVFLKSWVSFTQTKMPIFATLKDKDKLSGNMIMDYFKNHFNEPIHQQFEAETKLINDFITISLIKEDPTSAKNINSVLQFFHFLNRKDNYA